MRHRIRGIGVALALVVVCSLAPAPASVQAQTITRCRDWGHSGDLDTRFKVWACRDGDPAAAAADIARLAALVEEMWGPMTQAPPVGMGPPLPDAHGPNVPVEYGSDARIDFYALQPGQGVERDGLSAIADTAAAAARPAPPFTTPGGAPRASSSGYVLVDRTRLYDDVQMRQDLIHEFFHVLQSAHNRRATYQGDTPHWFVDASATWAETYYLRQHSEIPHGWFETFQGFDTGLEDPDVKHQYAAYIWPFFMEQEVDKEAIMRAWVSIEGVRSRDFEGVTDAIDHELPFEQHFRDFAVRNLNNDALEETDPRETLYYDLDLGFHDAVPPGHMRSGSVAPGSPYVANQSMPPLSARYVNLSFPEEAREVTIDLGGLSPGSAVDGDAIVHYTDGYRERRPVEGMLRFCRDDEDIDQLYLVVSNHDRRETVTGPIEASARDRCADPDAIVLEGTIRAQITESPGESFRLATVGTIEVTMEVTITIEPHDWTTTGTARISGTYTGNCQFEDSDSGPMIEGSMHGSAPADPMKMVASVEVFSQDPRYLERPLTGLFLSVFARAAGEGGTCGHDFPPVEDAMLSVIAQGCTLEVFNHEGSFTGSCHEVSDSVNPHTGLPVWDVEWTANLEQTSPPPDDEEP